MMKVWTLSVDENVWTLRVGLDIAVVTWPEREAIVLHIHHTGKCILIPYDSCHCYYFVTNYQLLRPNTRFLAEN
jgi:hypothetical protein